MSPECQLRTVLCTSSEHSHLVFAVAERQRQQRRDAQLRHDFANFLQFGRGGSMRERQGAEAHDDVLHKRDQLVQGFCLLRV